MGVLDKMEQKLDELEGKVSDLESSPELEEEIDLDKPLSRLQMVMLICADVLVVFAIAGLVRLLLSGLAAILTVVFTIGVVLLGGLALLGGKHSSHKLTGLAMTIINVAALIWVWKG